MEKLTNKQIATAEKIINRLDIGVQVCLNATIECEAKEYVAKREDGRSYHAGTKNGVLHTIFILNMINLKEKKLLNDYYEEKLWQLITTMKHKTA